MGHLYYFFGLLMVIVNISLLPNIFKYHKINYWAATYLKVSGKPPKKEDFSDGEWDLFNVFVQSSVSTSFWIFLGILTQSWKIFILMTFLLFCINWFLKNWGSQSLPSKTLIVVKSLLVTVVPLILVINHFHLHLDLWSLLF